MELHHPVNVASVPQRSPFRYPGGKTWLIPYLRLWLLDRSQSTDLFIEPFAGGGVASLTAVAENYASRAIMVELDEDVSAVWRSVLGDDSAWLAKEIRSFKITPNSVRRRLDKPPTTLRERAFHTLLKNRVYHGGILAPGSGVMKMGENGKGIGSRWYPRTLSSRILAVAALKNRLNFIQGDGMDVIARYRSQARAKFFVDPPYTAAGKRAGLRLYKYSHLDHGKLFALMNTVRGDFLMTYDMNDEVMALAHRHGFLFARVAMSNTHNSRMTELLIGRNLDWLSALRPNRLPIITPEHADQVLRASA